MELSYSGATITHPGINASFAETTVGGHHGRDQWLLGIQAGFYFHRNMHATFYLMPWAGWIRTSKSGFQYGIDLPFGFAFARIPKVYKINSDGTMMRRQFRGTSHIAFAPALRLGHTIPSGSPFGEWFIKNKLLFVVPYAGGSSSRYLFEAGVVKLNHHEQNNH
jgi:hypothetical protein